MRKEDIIRIITAFIHTGKKLADGRF